MIHAGGPGGFLAKVFSRPRAAFIPACLPQDVPPELMSTIIDEYLDRASDAQARRHAFQDMIGDMLIYFPVFNFSRNLQGKPVPDYFLPQSKSWDITGGQAVIGDKFSPSSNPHLALHTRSCPKASSLASGCTAAVKAIPSRSLCRSRNQL